MSLAPLNMQDRFDTARGELEMQKAMSLKKSAGQTDAALKKAARDFEGFMMGQMFKSMYESVPKSDFFGDAGYARDMFMGVYIDEISKQAALGGNGIAAMVYKQMSGKKLDDPNLTTREILNELHTLAKNLEETQSSGFGMRKHPVLKKKSFHHGLDFALTEGDQVKLPSAGKITFAGKKGGYGKTVIVDHGHGISSLYAHLSKVDVVKGQYIEKGHVVGKTGSTGVSTGPHLHFEVKMDDNPIDLKRLAQLEKTAKGL